MKTQTNPNVALWRSNHHKALAALFGVHPSNGLALWKRLVRIERDASNNATRLCSDETYGQEQYEKDNAAIVERVRAIQGMLPKGFFVNGDPRGYALKIDDMTAQNITGLHKDMGGYGILAAQID